MGRYTFQNKENFSFKEIPCIAQGRWSGGCFWQRIWFLSLHESGTSFLILRLVKNFNVHIPWNDLEEDDTEAHNCNYYIIFNF